MNLKSFLFFILFIFYSSFLFAQQWIVSHTKLLKEPKQDSDSIGVLVRGAKVKLLHDKNTTYVKVEVDNGMEGYVKSKLIRKSLNVSDTYDSSTPPPFIENDGLYGSPHLFINVASLRGRVKPNLNSKIGKLFTMGEVVRVNFYPYNSEAWVNVNSYYVKQKYLGARPILKELNAQFDEIPKSNVEEREKISRRIYEFLWQNDRHAKLSALERCLESARQLKNEKLIENLLLDVESVKGSENKFSYDELQDLEKNQKNYILLNEHKIQGYEFTLKELLKAKGSPREKVKNEDECCFTGNMRYKYNDAEFVVDEEKKIVEISWISLKSNAYIIDGFVVNSKTSKKEFVKKLARLFYYNGLYPDNYSFPFLEYASIDIVFKNDKPDKFEFFVYP